MKKVIAAILCLLVIISSANAEDITLNILGGDTTLWELQFEQVHPEIRIQHGNITEDGQAYQTVLMTSNEYDIYQITTGPIYAALMNKGYICAIESDSVQKFLNASYPYIQSVLASKDRIYAVPCPEEDTVIENVMLGMWSYNYAVWMEEFHNAACPSTYCELLSQAIDWQKNKQDSDYRLCAAFPGEDGLSTEILRAYVAQYELKEAPLSFNTAIFRETMKLLKLYSDYFDYDDERPALILPYPGYLSESAENGYVWLEPPVFYKEDDPIIQASMQIYVINSRSNHKQEAVAYLEASLSAHNPFSLFMMLPDRTKEIRNGKTILVSEQSSAIAKKMLRKATVKLDSKFLGGEHYYAMMDFIQQYLSGALTIDQLINKLDSRASLVFMED